MDEKLEASRKAQRDQGRERNSSSIKSRWLIVKWGLVLVVAGAIIGFSYYQIGTTPKSNVSQAVGELHRQDFADQGQTHITDGSKDHPPYNSNPPSSGPHYPSPAAWGVYDQPLPDEKVIHNLEHGGVWISYRKDLDQESRDKLIALAKSYKTKVVLSPREDNPTKIALAAWTHTDTFDVLDEGRINAFFKAYKDKGPEFLPDSAV